MAEKKGKLFVKDSNGSVVQIIPEAVAVIPDYQGSTSATAGTSGLVPAALSTQREKYLRGDGTWQDACVPTGICNCTYAYVRRTFNAGVSICDGDGSWFSTAVTLDASIYPDEVRIYHIHFRFGADGPGGCAYWLPYNTTPPQSIEERTYEFYRDSTIFYRNNSNHFIQTFSNGFSMDSWIEADTEQSGYHYLYIRVYGPTAQDIPRAVPLNVDGTDVFLTQNLTAGQSADIPVSGTTIKLYPRPTHRTALYRNEFYEYSGAAGFEPVEITSTEYAPPYLSYTAIRTSTGIRITANSVNINDWPQELSSVALSLTSGSTTNVVDMNCLPYWMSTQLTKIDERIVAVNTRVTNIGIYQGATEDESGVIGLVPAPTSAEKDRFLRGDGTWAELTLPNVYQGATNSASGVAGLVPAASSADKDKFLRGDGTWQTVSTSSDRRVKQQFADIPDAVLDAWENAHWMQFKMNDEVQEKGDNATIHTGMVVQDLQDIFTAKGLNANLYDMISHEEWEATEEEKDKDGNVVVEASPAYEQWYLRYEQVLAIEAAYQRRRADQLEARIAALEAKMKD